MSGTLNALVIDTRRVGQTANGNPTFDVTLSTPTQGYPGTVTMRTKADASINGLIENSEYREKPHVFRVERGRLAGIVGEA